MFKEDVLGGVCCSCVFTKLKREISYLENLNTNEGTAYKNVINFALIFLKGNAIFVIDFAYYNIALSKARRSTFTHNQGPAMSYKIWSVARRHDT